MSVSGSRPPIMYASSDETEKDVKACLAKGSIPLVFVESDFLCEINTNNVKISTPTLLEIARALKNDDRKMLNEKFHLSQLGPATVTTHTGTGCIPDDFFPKKVPIKDNTAVVIMVGVSERESNHLFNITVDTFKLLSAESFQNIKLDYWFWVDKNHLTLANHSL